MLQKRFNKINVFKFLIVWYLHSKVRSKYKNDDIRLRQTFTMDDYRANGCESHQFSIISSAKFGRKLIISKSFKLSSWLRQDRLTVTFNFFYQHTNSLSRSSITCLLTVHEKLKSSMQQTRQRNLWRPFENTDVSSTCTQPSGRQWWHWYFLVKLYWTPWRWIIVPCINLSQVSILEHITSKCGLLRYLQQ